MTLVDDLVREARDLREGMIITAAKLDAFTQALQANVDRLRVISDEMTAAANQSDNREAEEDDDGQGS